MRSSIFAAVSLVSVSIVSMMSGCASAPPAVAPASQPAPGATLYVARRRWHIDVGFAVGDLQPPLAQPADRFPDARYLFFGFGDRRYLMAQRHAVPVLLAALWPGAGLILVTSLTASPRQAFGPDEVVALPLTLAQARALQTFIGQSLSHRQDGTLDFAPGPYEGSAYFEAIPRYSALHTCITWAAEALRAGGLPVRSRFTLVAAQLWNQVRRIPSVAGGRIAVLADHSRAASLGNDDGGFGGRRRAATADAASE